MKNIYGIVGTQRSGSNFVCSVLRSVSALGDPREYFNPVHIPSEEKITQSVSDASSFSKELLENTPDGETFGFKIHYIQFRQNFLQKNLKLEEAFPGIRIINLRRMNVVKQAISLWKAELTQSWTANMPPIRKAHYDYAQIQKRYFDLKIHDIMWRNYLAENRIPNLNIFYEDILSNKEKLFFQIFSYLGRPDLVSKIKAPEMKAQSDDTSLEWEEKFRSELSDEAYDKKSREWVSRCRFFQADKLGDNPDTWRPYEIIYE